MKPFNLQEALAGKPVVTRDGRKVTEIYHFKTAIPVKEGFPVTVVVDGECYTVTDLGKTSRFVHEESDSDLFMAPESIDVWVNVYKVGSGDHFCAVYHSEQEAKEKDTDDEFKLIKTEKITIEL